MVAAAQKTDRGGLLDRRRKREPAKKAHIRSATPTHATFLGARVAAGPQSCCRGACAKSPAPHPPSASDKVLRCGSIDRNRTRIADWDPSCQPARRPPGE